MSLNPVTGNVPATTPRTLNLAIVEEIANRHEVKVADILSPKRCKKIVAARDEAIRALGIANPRWSYPDLGRFFGRDHTTIMHSLQKTGGLLPRLPRLPPKKIQQEQPKAAPNAQA